MSLRKILYNISPGLLIGVFLGPIAGAWAQAVAVFRYIMTFRFYVLITLDLENDLIG